MPRWSASLLDAAAMVRPSTSSMTCSTRCLFERNTARRGRSAVPWIFLRTRACRMSRLERRFWATLLMFSSSLLPGLAGLAHDLLAQVANALALVRLGLANGSDVGSDLTDDLF